MSSCDSQIQIAPYLLGELSLADEESLVSHLQDCGGCRGDLEDFRMVIGLLDDPQSPVSSAPPVTGNEGFSPMRRSRRHLGSYAKVLAKAAVVVSLALGGYAIGAKSSTGGASTLNLIRDQSTLGQGSLTMHTTGALTLMTFSLHGLPRVGEVGAWVTLNSGRTTTICWWPATSARTLSIFRTVITTPITEVRSVGIETRSGTKLYWRKLA